MALVVGCLDGVNRDHRRLLAAAGEAGGTLAVLTWEKPGARLCSSREKRFLLERAGAARVLECAGAEEAAALLRADAALRDGEIFYERAGAASLLPEGAAEAAFAAGSYERALSILGAPYVIAGRVVRGKGAGRRHGMPTANLACEPEKILPPQGVYGVRAHLGSEVFRGVTNVGLRPSDDDMPHVSVETLLCGFDRDIYGEELLLELCFYLRPTRRFPGGLDEVRQQILRDAEETERRLNAEEKI